MTRRVMDKMWFGSRRDPDGSYPSPREPGPRGWSRSLHRRRPTRGPSYSKLEIGSYRIGRPWRRKTTHNGNSREKSGTLRQMTDRSKRESKDQRNHSGTIPSQILLVFLRHGILFLSPFTKAREHGYLRTGSSVTCLQRDEVLGQIGSGSP